MKKKSFITMLAVILVMTNCSQNEEIIESSPGKVLSITATIEGASRSTVNDAGVYSWADGDKISVGTTNGFVTFTYDEKSKEFKQPDDNVTYTLSGYAVYPAYADGETPENYDGNGIPTIELPASYDDNKSTNAPMLAEISENTGSGNINLHFKHLGGLLRFVVNNVPEGANQFVFEAKNKGITGDFTVTDEKEVNAKNSVNSDNTVTIGFARIDAPMVFYVPLPVETYNGYSVTIKDSDELNLSHESENVVNTVNRASLLLMPEFTVVEENGTKKLEKATGSTVNLVGGEQTMTVQGKDETVTVKIDESVQNPCLNLNLVPSDEQSCFTITDGSATDVASQESKATVNIGVNGEKKVSTLTVNAPTLTVKLVSGKYTTIKAKTALQTLVLGEGVEVETVEIDGGHVVIEEGATVTDVNPSHDNGGNVYVVDKREDPAASLGDDVTVLGSEEELELKVELENPSGDSSEYTLTEDVVLTEPLVIPAGKTMTIDLNGYTISQTKVQTAAYSMIQNNGTLIIKDTKMNGKIAYADEGNGGEYVSNTLINNGTLIIEGGLIENNSSATVAANGYPHPIDNNADLTINGGTFTNNANYSSMRIWCTEDDNTVVNINGGTFNGSIDFHNVSAKPNKGTLIINDGTFNADTYTNSAVRLLGFGTDVDEMCGYINGGKFTGKIALNNFVGGEFNSNVFEISGGTFSEDPTPYLINGKIAVEYNGTYSISDIDAANRTFTVKSVADFLYLNKLNEKWVELFSNGEGTAYSNYATENGGKGVDYYYDWTWTIKLDTDIDLEGITLDVPIKITDWGKFDGQGHFIKNVNIKTAADTETAAGLFIASQCTIENLKIDNVHVTGSFVGNSTAGILASDCNQGIKGITISNSSVTGGKYTGGVVGYGYTYVTNCELTDCVVKGGYKLGGIIGYICASNEESKEVVGNKLTGCTVNGADGQYAGGKSEYIVGKIVGNYNCNGTCKDNTIENMTTSAIDNIGKIEGSFTVVQE